MNNTSLGIGFLIGASVASSFANSLTTASQKIKAYNAEIAQERKKSAALQKAIDLEAQKEALKNEIRADKSNRKLLQDYKKLSKSYKEARKDALAYGKSVAEWTEEHKKASTQLEKHYQLRKQHNILSEQKSVRQNLMTEGVEVGAMAYMFAQPISDAISFESAMADATKTIEGMRDATGKLTERYYLTQSAIKKLGRDIPLTHEGLSALYAAGGQQGIKSVAQLEEFARLSAEMSVAFNMTAEESAEAIGGYRTALNLTMPEIRAMLDLMNQFANTTSATEKDIAEVVRRVGALGDVTGVSVKPMTALAATLTSMKVTPEIAATGIQNLILALTSGTAATASQRDAFTRLGLSAESLAKNMQLDGEGTIIEVLERISTLSKDEQASTLQQIFGRESIKSIAPLLSNLELLRTNFITSADASAYAGAMQEEYSNRAKTTANEMILMNNRMKEFSINVGSAVLPMLNSLFATIGPVASALADFTQNNQELVGVMGSAIAVYLGYRVASIGVRLAISGVRSAVASARIAHAAYNAIIARGAALSIAGKAKTLALAGAQKVATAAQWMFNAAMTANPVGIVVMSVAALIGVMVTLYNKSETVRKMFDRVFGFMGKKIDWAKEKIAPVLNGIKSAAKWFGFGDDEEISPHNQAQKKLDEENKQALEKASGLTLHSPEEEVVYMEMPDLSSFSAPQMPPLVIPENFDVASNAEQFSTQTNQQVQVDMNFAINGITDKNFAERLIKALKEKKIDLEEIISEIVHDQSRVAYE